MSENTKTKLTMYSHKKIVCFHRRTYEIRFIKEIGKSSIVPTNRYGNLQTAMHEKKSIYLPLYFDIHFIYDNNLSFKFVCHPY